MVNDFSTLQPFYPPLKLATASSNKSRPSASSRSSIQTFTDALQQAARRAGRLSPVSTGQALLQRIRGFDQTDPSEYNSLSQARTWGYSTCSAAALTAVLRGLGLPTRIADVMQAMSGGLSVDLGLTSRPALVKAAGQFGLKASDDIQSYEDLEQSTAAGQPVLVDVTNDIFPEGHWMAVTGAGPDGVIVADSSRYNLGFISKDDFLAGWSGRGIRAQIPGKLQQQIASTLGEQTG